MPDGAPPSFAVLPSLVAEGQDRDSFIVTIRSREEFLHWLNDPRSGCEGIQVEGLLDDSDLWSIAAQGDGGPPIDLVLDDPAAEYSLLYRLVDVRLVRPVRVTIPAKPGSLKALRLAAAIQLPVRILPGQPDAEALAELAEAAQFYLRDPMVEVPVEYFHSSLAFFRGSADGNLWDFLEENPAFFPRFDETGQRIEGADFVANHLKNLDHAKSECAGCRWRAVCGGYFKQPSPEYHCAGVKEIFAEIESAAAEIENDLRKAGISSR